MENNQLVVGQIPAFEKFTIRPEILQMRDEALATSALIGKVETSKQNEASAAARKKIKSILSLFETGRKKHKEPVLEYGREIDRIVDAEREDLQREDGRLENLEKDFIRTELRRKANEEELQRKELARIEAEKQAELLRIAREQAEAERKARIAAEEANRKAQEAAAAAQRLLDEAKNKQQREAAERARAEAAKQAETARIETERQAAESAENARQQQQLANDRAAMASHIESKPIGIDRAKGQTVKKVWVIDQINDFQLMRSRPDLVRRIDWDITGIKAALAEGVTLPGVVAHEDIRVDQRGGKSAAILDV